MQGNVIKIVLSVLGIVFLVIAVALVFWVYRDAKRRDGRATLWTVILAVLGTVGGVIGLTMTSSLGFGGVGITAFVTVLVGLIAYKLIRPHDYAADAEEQELSIALLEAELDVKSCPRCHHGIEPDFITCPDCGELLKVPCQHCGRPIKKNAKYCPYCSSKGDSLS